jgi:DNA-binding XRE family transcriptional regulator
MQVDMKIHSTGDKRAEISLSIPVTDAAKVAETIRSVLTLAGHKVRRLNEEGERVYSAAEVFPEGSPAMLLRGLRGKMDLTQAEMAVRLGISQNRVSDMESGNRAISPKMAKLIGEKFGMPYKLFL